jgi:basic amino acid/polyamine antiporter, APA family
MGFRVKVTVSHERWTAIIRKRRPAAPQNEIRRRERMDLFRTKSIDTILSEAEDTGEGTLKRTLGVSALTLLGVGAIIGTGIFVLTGQAAGRHAGPAVVISMVVAGIVSALAALCYSEFASSVPISGSAYTYSYATLGEFIAWVIGWDLILEYAFGAATVAAGWSGNMISLLADLGIVFPVSLSAAPGTKFVALNVQSAAALANMRIGDAVLNPPVGYNVLTNELARGLASAGINAPVQTALFNLPAFLIAIAVTALLVRGIRESANFNSVVVLVKVGVVLLFIIAGVGYVNTHYLGFGCERGLGDCLEFVPPNTGVFGEYGYSGILTGAAVIFFAYIGFDAVSTAAQEAKNPQLDMPRAIIGSLIICTILYVLVAAIMVGLVPYTQLKEEAAPIAAAITAASGMAVEGSTIAFILKSFSIIIKIGAVLGLSSTMVVQIMGQPRIFYAMGKDGLLPAWAAKIHPRFRTPHVTTMITGAIVAVMAALVPISALGQLVSIGTLFAFVIVSIGVIVLRKTRPDLPRPFKVPFSPFVPILCALSSLYLMYGLPFDTWARLILWMAVGIVIYFLYGKKNSKLRDTAAPLNTK